MSRYTDASFRASSFRPPSFTRLPPRASLKFGPDIDIDGRYIGGDSGEQCTNGISRFFRMEKCAGVYIIFGIVVLAIFLYWAVMVWYLKKSMIHNDLMNQKVFNMSIFPGCCSWWPLSHFALFFIIGLLYPNCGVVAMVGGIIWEGFEVIMGSLTPKEQQNGTQSNIEYDQWWSGSFRDILFNAAGFYSAKLFRYLCDRATS